MIIRSDPYNKILGIGNSIPCHRNDTVHKRLSFPHRAVYSHYGIHVVHNTAYIRRQHGRIDGASRHRKNKLTLRSLRIFGFQLLNRNPRLFGSHFFQQLNAVRLIVLYRQNSFCIGEQAQNYLKASDKLIGFLQHTPVIRGKIRLTLGTVGDHVFYFVRFLG